MLVHIIAAPNGIQAMVLRVFFWDDAPAYGVNVKFKQKDAAAPAEAYTVWSDQYGSALVIIPVLSDVAFEYFVAASGVGTANLKVYLVGYMEIGQRRRDPGEDPGADRPQRSGQWHRGFHLR